MALFGFGKKKDIPTTFNQTSAPVANADDFFKDMGRKKKAPTSVVDIPVPEVTGLHDAPLPPPGSTIRNIAEVDPSSLRDKTLDAPDPAHANIRAIKDNIDTTVIPKEEKILRSPKVITADDFFRDLDRRQRPVKNDIDVPEVTGLRDAPPAHHVTDIGDAFADDNEVTALKDKTHEPDTFVHGDINTVDINTIDLSSLRPEN
ncbi:MAG: hypothetical protein IJ080_02850 [Oscillospiraceae bacterium]|nr:hypothetical protein [Oscillospiraceae bacterium]